MRRRLVAGVLVSAVFLYLFLRGTDWAALWDVLPRVRLVYLVPATGVYLAAMAVRALRWRFLMGWGRGIPYRAFLGAVFVGFAANVLLPARSGELVRAYALGRRASLATTTALGSIVIERVLDGFTVVAMVPPALALAHLPSESGGSLLSARAVWWMGAMALAFFLAIALLLALVRWKWHTAERGLLFCLRPLPARVRELALSGGRSFAGGLGWCRGRDLAAAAVLSGLVWLLGSLSIAALLPAFRIAPSLWDALFAQVVIALAVMIPAAPGFLGTFHAAVAAAMVALGTDPATAKGFSLLLWCVNFVPVTALGLAVAWGYGMSWSSAAAASRRSSVTPVRDAPAG